MKDIKIKKGFAAAVVFLAVALFTVIFSVGCSNKTTPSDSGYFSVIFVQKGEEDIVIEVKRGEGVKEIPQPSEVAGYDVAWEKKDLTEITEDITVRAVYTPKRYTVYYELGILEGKAEISSRTQTAVYNENITLFIPVDKSDTYVFTGYVIKGSEETFSDGIYSRASDITLIAQWKRVWSGDYS